MNDTSLDEAALYERLDPQGLRGRIAGLPDQIGEAWRAAQALELADTLGACDSVAVLGMGGSGIGGALLQALAIDLGSPWPVTVVRGYTLPAHVTPRTLVLASSNSGNTEEVVATFEQALQSGAPCLAITSGGRLGELAQKFSVPVLTVRWEHEPRAAVGWSFATLLAICGRAGLVLDQSSHLADALEEMGAFGRTLDADQPEMRNPAKQLARRLHGRLTMIVGAESLAPVAYRWRTQINENAKSWAIADQLPEMNHNAQTGFGLPAGAVPLLHGVFLCHASMHTRNRLRVEGTIEEMRAAGVSAEAIDVDGASLLSQMLQALLLGDWTSYYLGLLNGVQPSPVDALVRLKDWLAAR